MQDKKIQRIRLGWYRGPTPHKLVLQAVQQNCLLSGAHALSFSGGWIPHGAQLQFQTLSGNPTSVKGVSVHHRPRVQVKECRYGLVPWEVALHHAFQGLELCEQVAIIDSLLNAKVDRQINRRELSNYLASNGWAKVLGLTDKGAQPGIESLARVRLIQMGHDVRTQVQLENGWPIDLLIDRRIALEIDGNTHGAPEQWRRDIKKSHLSTRAGYLNLRLSYWDVTEGWAE